MSDITRCNLVVSDNSTDRGTGWLASARHLYITSAIQRINGASLKEHWAAQRNQVYSSIRCTAVSGAQTVVSVTSARYWPEI